MQIHLLISPFQSTEKAAATKTVTISHCLSDYFLGGILNEDQFHGSVVANSPFSQPFFVRPLSSTTHPISHCHRVLRIKRWSGRNKCELMDFDFFNFKFRGRSSLDSVTTIMYVIIFGMIKIQALGGGRNYFATPVWVGVIIILGISSGKGKYFWWWILLFSKDIISLEKNGRCISLALIESYIRRSGRKFVVILFNSWKNN